MNGVALIIPAAGAGTRFGGKKPFGLVRGKPLVRHVLSAFEFIPPNQRVIVGRPQDDSEWRSYRQDAVFTYAAPKTVFESVLYGMDVLPYFAEGLHTLWVAWADTVGFDADSLRGISETASLHLPGFNDTHVVVPMRVTCRGYASYLPARAYQALNVSTTPFLTDCGVFAFNVRGPARFACLRRALQACPAGLSWPEFIATQNVVAVPWPSNLGHGINTPTDIRIAEMN